MADHGEALEAQLGHDLHLVLGHGALGIGLVVGAAGRLGGAAVAAQICRHHGEAPGQGRRQLVPHDVSLGITVQQEQRRAVARHAQVDLGAGGADSLGLEAFEHDAMLRPRPARVQWAGRLSGYRNYRSDCREPTIRLSMRGGGADERTRTSTSLRTQAPEACASTNSATSACGPAVFPRGWDGGRLVRLRGLEPPRGLPHSALNAARLPIPPQPRL